MLNHFGQEGGFQSFQNQIEDQEHKITFKRLTQYVKIVGNQAQILNRTFALEFLPKFCQSVISYLKTAQKDILRTLTKSDIDTISTCLQKLMQRYMSEKERNELIEVFNLEMAMNVFNADSLQQKIDGLQMIVAMIRNVKYNQYKFLTFSFIKSWIKKNNVFKILYNADSHVQLLKNSSDFLRIYISEHLMQMEDLKQIL